jgi:hypothetical protein
MSEQKLRSFTRRGGALDLSRAVLDPDEKIFFASLTLINKPGALASVFDLFKKHKINIVGILSESISKKEEIEISVFLETSDKVKKKELESALRNEMGSKKVEVLRKLRVFDHLEGFDADVYHFHLTVGRSKAVIFPLHALEGLVKTLRNTLNPTAVQAILWYQGKEIGKSEKELYEKDYKAKSVQQAVELLKARTLLLGWGITEVIKVDEKKKSARIRLFDSWECNMFKGNNNGPQNHFFRGILAGFFSSLFEVELGATEVKCIARGDPFCEFVVEKAEKS